MNEFQLETGHQYLNDTSSTLTKSSTNCGDLRYLPKTVSNKNKTKQKNLLPFELTNTANKSDVVSGEIKQGTELYATTATYANLPIC